MNQPSPEEGFVLCVGCEVAFSPEEFTLYCGGCAPRHPGSRDWNAGMALITSRTSRSTRQHFNMESKRRYDALVALGGKVFILVDEDGSMDGPVYDWQNITGPPAYQSIIEWVEAMTEEGRTIEYGWRQKRYPKKGNN